jgi:tRNA uridine 5-carbamoylmethylation protein Kti12
MSFYIIIRGPLGCGKSTIAKKISKILKAKYFAVDMVLEKYDLTKDKEAGYISQRSFKKANEIISPQAKDVLDKGISIVFDGNFYWKSQIEDLISRLDFPHYVFTLKAPLEVCMARDIEREKTHGKDAALAVYKKSTEFDYGTIIDINRPLEVCVKDILSYLPKS